MQISKNKKYQYLFFSILSIFIIFNGGNSNLLIQFNFILISLFFLYCLKDKNYNLHLKRFYLNNKKSVFLYLTFLVFLLFQIIPLPDNILKYFSPEKFSMLYLIGNISYSSVSLSPSNSYFQILNFTYLLLVVLICRMIFYKEKHKYRFFFYLSIAGFISSIISVLLYLNGNPDLYFLNNSYYKKASTGFFINRTVFSIFLLFCLISSLEILKNLELKKEIKNNYVFFRKIYIRLFVVFITIGIVTSFSRIGNFLLLITVLFYLFNELFVLKSKNNSFRILILFIILFDLLILGIYFGSTEIVSRFYFLKEEFSSISDNVSNTSRFDLIKFGIVEIKNFIFFGYGAGGFENLFKLKFQNSSNLFANHSHSDIVEFIGEFGLLGFILILSSLIKFFLNKKNYHFLNILIISFLVIILLFDFSLHVPLIQILFIIFFSINNKFVTQ